MPFTEDMIYRAAKQAADSFLRQLAQTGPHVVSQTDNTTGMPNVGHPLQRRCFIVGEQGSMSDIEMMKCEHCEMWYPSGRVCPCMWLEESSLEKEPEYEAVLDVPKVDYPFTCKNCGFQVLGPEHTCRVESRHR